MKIQNPYKKTALTLGLCVILLCAFFGTSASLAWFSAESPVIKNVFQFGEFDLKVSYRQEDGRYTELKGDQPIFDDQAIYEPGYVQVVHLLVENVGTVPFDLNAAVRVTNYSVATNALGLPFLLQEYLEFAMVWDESEAWLASKVGSREALKTIAWEPLNNYYETDMPSLDAGEDLYVALVVWMPEDIGNEANYRGNTVPTVGLGVTITASQQN